MLGSFNNRQPKIKISVQGTNEKPTEIDAIVDTGFNGYLKIPYITAFPLGLPLAGVESSTVSDGRTCENFICKGKVCIEGKCVDTSIDVSPAEIIMIGTGLLYELKKKLIFNAHVGHVEVIDSTEAEPKKAFEAVAIPAVEEKQS